MLVGPHQGAPTANPLEVMITPKIREGVGYFFL
jgi:hypothetical protein